MANRMESRPANIGSTVELKRRLSSEIQKLEKQLNRLQLAKSQHRQALIETYRSMIDAREDLLRQVEKQAW